jgi:hypothetical protein
MPFLTDKKDKKAFFSLQITSETSKIGWEKADQTSFWSMTGIGCFIRQRMRIALVSETLAYEGV